MSSFKLFVFLMLIPLSGCFYQSVSNIDIRKSITYCGTLENVASIQSTFAGGEIAFCDNKESGNLNGVHLESK